MLFDHCCQTGSSQLISGLEFVVGSELLTLFYLLASTSSWKALPQHHFWSWKETVLFPRGFTFTTFQSFSPFPLNNDQGGLVLTVMNTEEGKFHDPSFFIPRRLTLCLSLPLFYQVALHCYLLTAHKSWEILPSRFPLLFSISSQSSIVVKREKKQPYTLPYPCTFFTPSFPELFSLLPLMKESCRQ